MIPWTHIAAAPIPGGTEHLRLVRRGNEFSIRLGAVELMNSRLSGSEEALAARTIAALPAGTRPKILIGGLGMGFTLRAALGALGPDAQVIVAELVPAVVAWAHGPMAGVFQGCLDDPRVAIIEEDVGALVGAAQAVYDAILLDVDNGPAGQVRDANQGLYGRRGLGAAHRALRPGGLLSVWSVAPDDGFAGRLCTAGFSVDEVRVRAHVGTRGKRGARHTIWIARRT